MYYSKIYLKVLRKSRANLLDSRAQGWLSYFEQPDYKISADYEIAIVLLHYIHIHICTACTNVCIYGTNSYEVRFINIKYPQLFKPRHIDLKIFKFHYVTTLYLLHLNRNKILTLLKRNIIYPLPNRNGVSNILFKSKSSFRSFWSLHKPSVFKALLSLRFWSTNSDPG